MAGDGAKSGGTTRARAGRAARRRSGGASGALATWLARGGIALLLGALAGAGGGWAAMRWLGAGAPAVAAPEPEPAPVTRSAEAPVRRRAMRGPRADGMRGDAYVGGGAIAEADSLAVVPDLVGRTEGDARRLLELAGFALGDLLFQEDDGPTGLVLATFPVSGERVALPATVNLVLSDRRRTFDTSGVFGDTLVLPDTVGVFDDARRMPDTVGVFDDDTLARPDTLGTDGDVRAVVRSPFP